MSCICKLIKKYSSLYLFAGKKMGQRKQTAKPDIVGKENTNSQDIAALEMITTAQREK